MDSALNIDPSNHVEPGDTACANCYWWVPPPGEVRPPHGTCHGAPPTVLLVPTDDGGVTLANARPVTRRGDFCGMFSPPTVAEASLALARKALPAILDPLVEAIVTPKPEEPNAT